LRRPPGAAAAIGSFSAGSNATLLLVPRRPDRPPTLAVQLGQPATSRVVSRRARE
jgi:hypothetical protein